METAGETGPRARAPVIRRLRSCLAGVGCLTLLAAAAAGAWHYRAQITDAWERWTGDAPAAVEPSEELAARTERRIREALAPSGPAELRLTAVEVESLVRYRAARGLPDGVTEPSVTLADSTASASATVDVERVAGDRLPDMVRRMVGDSTRVTVRVVPRVPRTGVLRLEVREFRAGAVGLPPVMLPWLLAQMGMPVSEEDARAMDFRVGGGLTGAHVRDSTLVLRRGAKGRS